MKRKQAGECMVVLLVVVMAWTAAVAWKSQEVCKSHQAQCATQ